MAKEKCEIKEIVLDLGKLEVKLTLEQAQKLHDTLNELFEKKIVTVPGPSVPYPVYPPYRGPWRWEYSQPSWYGNAGTSSGLNGIPVQYTASNCSLSMKL